MAPAATLADRLASESARSFVGRGAELALFAEALASPNPPFAVLYLFGPGGIGKTTLLHQFAAMAGAAGASVALVNGQELEPSPQIFEGAMAMAFAGDPRQRPPGSPRIVLLLDSFETLAPLDEWLRRKFLPALPADALVVLASRADPLPGWSTEAGWSSMCRRVALRGLSPDESAEFLRQRGVPEPLAPALLDGALGHPLALTLAADSALRTGRSDGADRIDMTKALIGRLVAETPGPLHRAALELACHAWRTDEALIADVVDAASAPALLEWLRVQPFIQTAAEGVYPHDLVRELVDADYRWRDPLAFGAMHRRIRNHYQHRIVTGSPEQRFRALRESVFLHRMNPVMAEYFKFRAFGRVIVEPATPADHPAIIALVEAFEGLASARIARHWLDRQPEAFFAARDGSDRLAGFITHLDPLVADAGDRAADPVLAAIAPLLAAASPRPGETVVLDRFNIAADTYQSPSPTLGALQIHSYQTWMAPRLSWALLTTNAAAPWDNLMRYIDFAPLAGRDFSVGNTRHRVYAHDWRQVPMLAWFEMMEDRETDIAMRPEQLEPARPELVVLSRQAFDEAVREALKSLNNNAALAASPLLRSRIVAPNSGAAGLRDCLLSVTHSALKADPRDDKFFRAIELTYLAPVGKQEAVAERLGLPFGTYRYRLNTAIERVVDRLWRREIETAPSAA